MGSRKRAGPDRARRGERLPVRLRRERPWATERLRAFLVGLACLAPALAVGGILVYRWEQTSLSDRVWVGAFSGLFGLIGLLAIYTGIHQQLASRVGETIVETERNAVNPGGTIQVCLRQPGPARLRSLRAKLVCRTTLGPTRAQRGREEPALGRETYVFHDCFLDARDLSAPAGGMVEVRAPMRVPQDARPTGRYPRAHPGDHEPEYEQVTWLIEVWGRVPWRPGFVHSHEIMVRGRAREGSSD